MWLLVEFQCRRCGRRTESLEKRDDVPPTARCECGATADRVISAPAVKVQKVFAVSMGKSDPLPASCPDFRTVGEGEPLADFKARRRKYWREQDRKRTKDALRHL